MEGTTAVAQPVQAPTARDRILVVDDDRALRERLAFGLGQAGFAVDTAGNGSDGLVLAAAIRPAVVILEMVLPDVSGTDVCRALRTNGPLADAGVLMLTTRGEERDRLAAFEMGVDDYVVKPFSLPELVMRVRSVARRSACRHAPAAVAERRRLHWKGLQLDPASRQFYIDEAKRPLRPLEFKLIHVLLANPGLVLSREELIEKVWGATTRIGPRTVDTNVRRLRQRLGTYREAVETVTGFGYRLKEL